MTTIKKDLQYYKFCAYGFLKNLRFFDPFLLLFFLEKGLNLAQVGVLYALREILVNVTEIPSGIVADALGRRRSMLMSFSAYIVSFLMFFFFGSFWLFVPAMLFFSLGEAFRTGTHKAMIFEYLVLTGQEGLKTHYYGHTRSWSQIGSALSALLAGLLVLWQGSYRTVFLFSLIPYLLDFFLMLSYPRSLDGSSGRGFPDSDGNAGLPGQFKAVFSSFISSLKHPRTLTALVDSSLFSGYIKGVKDFLQLILQALALALPMKWAVDLHADSEGKTAILIGIWYTGIYLLSALASRMSAHLAGGSLRTRALAASQDNSGGVNIRAVRALLIWTLLVGSAVTALAGILDLRDMALPAALLFSLVYILENLRKPAAVVRVSDAATSDVQASVLSVESQIKTVIAALFALVLGISSDKLGIGTGLIIASAVLLLLYILLKFALHFAIRASGNRTAPPAQ